MDSLQQNQNLLCLFDVTLEIVLTQVLRPLTPTQA